jgi:hypothetical protein
MTQRRELERQSDLSVRTVGSTSRGDRIRVTARNGEIMSVHLTDRNRRQRTITAKAVNLIVEDGRIVALDN